MFKKTLLITSLCFLPLMGFAKNPIQKSFADNQMIPVCLSDTNINRIIVKGDQITQVVCPSQFCISQHNKHDQSGSALVKLNSPIPFTLFLQTRLGHHVSLQVTPIQGSGKTYVLNPTNHSIKAATWEKQSAYRNMLIRLIKAMMRNHVPDGYGYQVAAYSDWKTVFQGLAKMQIKAIWQGAQLLGVEHLFYNNSKRTLVLPESAFYHKGVRLVATTEQSVASHGYETVYEILDRSNNHG